jgi:hypothetical protein
MSAAKPTLKHELRVGTPRDDENSVGDSEKKRVRDRTAGWQYLFTGLLYCADCRGSITIVSGQWKQRDESRYGCSMHAYRGDRVTQLLAGLQAKILHPDLVQYTFAGFEAELASVGLSSFLRTRVAAEAMDLERAKPETFCCNCHANFFLALPYSARAPRPPEGGRYE